MRIYDLSPIDDALLFSADVQHQLTVLRPLGRGQSYEGHWVPLPVWPLKKPRKRRTEPLCDLSSVAAMSSLPVLSARARQCFEPILEPYAQWLPLAFDDEPRWLLNSLRVIEALDEPRSQITRFDDGRVSGIETYAFVESQVADEWLFKVATFPYLVLVTDRFRDLVMRSGLTGFHFQPVWDSEHRPFRPTPGKAEMLTRPEIYGPDGFVPNMREYWPAEWKEQARQMKRSGKAGATIGP